MDTNSSFIIFFDGACHLCSREIAYMRRIESRGRVRFVDIAAPGFSAQEEGLDPMRVQETLHIRAPSGEVHSELDAVIEMWRLFPAFAPLARLAERDRLRPLFAAWYRTFARLRKRLPKRRVARRPASA